MIARFLQRMLRKQNPSFLVLDPENYTRSVLHKALGDDKSTDIISRILEGSDTSGIEGLKWIDSPSVAELIRGEHPQIIATILVHLDRDQASEILGQLSEQLRNDVLLRIATLEGIQPSALRELNDVLTDLLSGSENIIKARSAAYARRRKSSTSWAARLKLPSLTICVNLMRIWHRRSWTR